MRFRQVRTVHFAYLPLIINMIAAVAITDYKELQTIISAFNSLDLIMTVIGVTMKTEEQNLPLKDKAKLALKLSKEAVDVGIAYELKQNKSEVWVATKEEFTHRGIGINIHEALKEAYEQLSIK